MNIKLGHSLFLTLLAILFAIGLTFASIELPRLADSFLKDKVDYPGFDSRANESNIFTAELYIQHYHIRLIGYVCFALVILMIVVGFITNKTGLASAGAIAFFLPVFAQFALVMFFLAGLGMLNLIWMPLLDVSYDVMRLGNIVYIPYRILAYIASLLHFDIYAPLSYTLIGGGLLLFTLGTLAWFHARFQKKGTAVLWVYRISRHPQYLGWIIWSYGLLIYLTRMNYPKRTWGISSSLPWLVSTMVIIGVAMMEELKMRRERGEEYEPYFRQTPFMFPMPRIISKIFAAPMRLIIRKEHPSRKREVAAVIAFYTVILMLLSAIFGGLTSPSEIRNRVFRSEEKNVEALVKDFKEAEGWRKKHPIAMSLAEAGEPAVEPLIELLKDEDPVVREYSIKALGQIRSDKAVKPLLGLLSDKDSNIRCFSAIALGEIRSEEAVQPLMNSLNDENGVVRCNVAEALGGIGSEEAVGSLIASLHDKQWYVRIASANALGKIKSEGAVDPLVEALRDENEKVRRASAVALSRIGSEKAAAGLTEALKDEDWEVRLYAAEALERIRNP